MPEVLTSNIEAKPGYKQTKLGWIPEEWDIKALSELMSFRNGANADKSDYGQGIRFINVLEVLNNTFITPEAIHGRVTLEENEIERNLVKSGDILFNRTSETPEDIGMTAVYLGDEPVVFGGFVIKGSSLNDELNVRFKGYCFNSSFLRKQIIARGQGAVRSNIGQKDLEKVLLPLPPLIEQQKIGEILSTWDAAIAKMEALITQKQRLKKGLMQQLLTGKKRFAEFIKSEKTKTTKLGEIPSDWRFEEIGEEIDLLSGFAFSSKKYSKEGIRLLRGANIKRGQSNWSDGLTIYWNDDLESFSRYQLESGDLVIAMDGSLVGRSYALLNESDLPALLLQRVARIRSSQIDIQYLKEFIGSKHFVQHCDSVKTVTAIPHISSKDIKKFKVPLPTIQEQQKIASVLSAADEEIESLNQHLAQLKEQKKGLMEKLLTGEVRVKVD